MSDWLFDLGNSRLKHAPLADGSRRDDGGNAGVGDVSGIGHDGMRFAAGWEAGLPAAIDVAWVASVGPAPLRDALLGALQARARRVVVVATAPRVAGIAIAYAQPSRLGVDRALAMAAAHARVPGWSLVVGVGTALTVDLVDGDGVHRGGRIAPSPMLMREALHARAAQLPRDGGDYAEFAADTGNALASGCLGAALGLVERSLREARSLAGEAPRAWLHGGGAADLLLWLDGAVHAPALVLEGLALRARMRDDAG